MILLTILQQIPITTPPSSTSIFDNSTFLIIFTTFLASIVTTLLANYGARWIDKRKVPVEVKQINANANLTDSEIADKYREMIGKTADENIELMEKNKQLRDDIEQLRCEMLASNASNKRFLEESNATNQKALQELRQSFETEIERGKKFEDWARRLVLELQAWNIEPVPFDVEEAKQLKIQNRKDENDSDFMNKKK